MSILDIEKNYGDEIYGCDPNHSEASEAVSCTLHIDRIKCMQILYLYALLVHSFHCILIRQITFIRFLKKWPLKGFSNKYYRAMLLMLWIVSSNVIWLQWRFLRELAFLISKSIFVFSSCLWSNKFICFTASQGYYCELNSNVKILIL